MAFKRDDRNMDEFKVYVSLHVGKELRRLGKLHGLTVSRLISYAIENEMLEENGFQVDLTLPESTVEHSYAGEANRILGYLKKLRTGMTLDLLYIARHDFGVPDKTAFLGGLKECLDQKMVEEYLAPPTVKDGKTVKDECLKYRARVNNPVVRKKILKKAKTKEQEYQEYLKLQKKFGNKE